MEQTYKKGECKTPEDAFKINHFESSDNWKYAGQKVYGPYFFREIQPVRIVSRPAALYFI